MAATATKKVDRKVAESSTVIADPEQPENEGKAPESEQPPAPKLHKMEPEAGYLVFERKGKSLTLLNPGEPVEAEGNQEAIEKCVGDIESGTFVSVHSRYVWAFGK